MKTLLFLIITVAMAFSQGAPATLSAQVTEWQWFKTIATTTDTLVNGSAKDSMTLVPAQGFPKGYEYVLSRGAERAAAGSIADSVQLIVYLDRYDATGAAVVQRTAIDTIGGGSTPGDVANGEQIVLPIGKTQLGGIFRIKLLAGEAHTTATADKQVIDYVELYRRRLVP